VALGGENALPCFSANGVDAVALERIVYNTQAWASPLQEAAALQRFARSSMHSAGGSANAVSSGSAGSPPTEPRRTSSSPPSDFQKDPRWARGGRAECSPTPRRLRILPALLCSILRMASETSRSAGERSVRAGWNFNQGSRGPFNVQWLRVQVWSDRQTMMHGAARLVHDRLRCERRSALSRRGTMVVGAGLRRSCCRRRRWR
jgi:hypothetical protein